MKFEIEKTKGQIKENKTKIDNIVESIAATGTSAITTLLEKKLTELTEKQSQLEQKKDELTVAAASSPKMIQKQIVLKALQNFSELYDELSHTDQANLLRATIQEIKVYEKDVYIQIHGFPEELTKIIQCSKEQTFWLPART